MRKTTIRIPKMDCASEENLVRMVLQQSSAIRSLKFDLDKREIEIVHSGESQPVHEIVGSAGLGAELLRSEAFEEENDSEILANQSNDEVKVLKQLLAINFTMFIVELLIGWYGQSTGLLADSLDMLADAAVYSLSLFAVSRGILWQKRSARFSGYLQISLALGALCEVGRRLLVGSEPQSMLMIIVAGLALAANVTCMVLLAKHRTGGVHMKASWIFSTNDVIANIGVVIAGILVTFTQSNLPDLVVGLIISIVVLRGALNILKISKAIGE